MQSTIIHPGTDRQRVRPRREHRSEEKDQLTTVSRLRSYVNRILAAFALLLLAPLFLFIAVWIRRDSDGPVLFRQRRLGLYGKPFDIFKFRSMYRDAETRLQHILESDPVLKAEFDIFHKLRDDPRVTPAGKFLRRFSLDELPQLINVVRGEMNIVGPRAYLVTERDRMNGDCEKILSRKPGLTGLWQVSGRNDLPFSERVELEKWYVENRTPLLDAKIVAKTVGVIVGGRGAN